MLVSIIIPCYNSEATIEKVVTMVMDEFSQHDEYDCDFFLVNDYSRDDTFGAITPDRTRHQSDAQLRPA